MGRNWISKLFRRVRPIKRKPRQRRVPLSLEVLEDRCVLSPIATFSNNGPVNEGIPVRVTFSKASDIAAETAAGFHYSFALRSTLSTQPLATTYAAASTASSASFTLNQSGVWTIFGRIFDKDNGYRTCTTHVTVRSAPTATLTNDGPVDVGIPVAVAFTSAADPTPAYVKAGFHYSFALSASSLAASYAAAGTSTSTGFTFTNSGTYTIYGRIFDKGNRSNTYTTLVTVNNGTSLINSNPYITTPYLNIPNFGARPTVVSVKSGSWSDPTIWSPEGVPTAGAIVDINPGTTVTYDVDDVNATATLNTLEIQATGTLTFRTDTNTELNVVNLVVLSGGELDIGTQANPVAANVTATVVFANQPLNTTLDPEQYGNGLIVLGTMTTFGAVKAPYVTLAQEANAGDTVLHLASPATGWQVGDRLQLPDTRQLDYGGDYGSYVPQWESVTIQAISADGLTVTLGSALQFNHLGATDVNGVLDYLPQVMDMTRNVSIHSQSPTGTRSYALFTDRADVNINCTSFGGMGRTTGNAVDDTTFDSGGNVTHVGTNEENRNPITFLDLFGPTTPQANGYQYTFTGNVVSCPLEPMPYIWGINVANSFYGLIQNNDLSNWNGAGIAVDGASSYNTFNANFVMRVTGTSNRPDQALQGDAFWFGNPNNYITNNIATDINGGGWTVYSYGYSIDVTGGMEGSQDGGSTAALLPAYQGADPSVAGQSRQLNMNDTPILQFSNNEVYGATSSGMTVWWLGTFGDNFYADAQVSIVKDFLAWNIGTRAFYGYPTDNLVINDMVVRGDTSYLSNGYNYSQGINFDDYMTRNLVIQNCDIQGMYTGINAPFMVGRVSATNTTTIKNCFLDNIVNIDLTPPRSVNGSDGLSPGTLAIINVQFANPAQAPQNWWSNIAMSYLTSDSLGTASMNIPQNVDVTNYDDVQGDNFQVFYSETPSPTGTAPANAKTVSDIDGLVVTT